MSGPLARAAALVLAAVIVAGCTGGTVEQAPTGPSTSQKERDLIRKDNEILELSNKVSDDIGAATDARNADDAEKAKEATTRAETRLEDCQKKMGEMRAMAYDEASRQLVESEARVLEMQREMVSLSRRMNELTSELVDFEKRSGAITARIKSASTKQELEAAKAESDKLHADWAVKENQYNELVRQFNELKKRFNDAAEQTNALRKAL